MDEVSTGAPARALCDQDLADLFEQERDVLINTPPEDLEVERKVGVGDDVPHAGDLAPGYVGVPGSQIGRELLYGLPDDMEIMEDPIEAQAVIEKLIAVQALGVLNDPGAALLDIREELDVTT